MHEHEHDHDHAHHCHPHSHEHTGDKPMSPEEVLALLNYMLDHNRHHADELHDICHALEDEGKAEAAAVLAEALDEACAVPLDIMDACCEGIRLAADYAAKGSVLAVSDAGCAALFCKAALQAAGLNVAINTKLMTDRLHAAGLDEKAARMLAEYVPLADEVYQSVASRLRA